jgi:serine/threonine protein kinase
MGDAAVGEQLGGYRLLEVLGEGGMGCVFRACHVKLGRQAAIKVLSSELVTDPDYVSRFFHEAKVVAEIGHPNIVDIVDFIESDSPRRVAYVMELLKGPTLSTALYERWLSVKQAINVALQLLDALVAVHAMNVVHRDLKPDNIIVLGSLDGDLSQRPSVKVLDFGIAKIEAPTISHHTQTGSLMGTPAYMAPEQFANEKITSATDIYAFGEILFEMLTRKRAFPGPNVATTMGDKLGPDPPPLEIPADVPRSRQLTDVVRSCLARRPADRPTAQAIAPVLREMLGSLSQGDRRMVVITQTAPPPRPRATSASQPEVVRFSAAQHPSVNPDAIERELAALWRTTAAQTESRSPVTRACLWNVVVHVEERPKTEGAQAAEELAGMIRDLPRFLAARALVLKTLPDGGLGPELESWVSANCILAKGGGKLVCSEEVVIAARGESELHLPALMRALLVPGVPTSVVFAGAPNVDRPMIEGLIQAADRVVAYADRSTTGAPLRRMRDLITRVPLGPIDLGWLEMSGVRSLIASLFDPPTKDEDIARIERVTLTSHPRHRWSVHLLIGWIAAALGVSSPARLGDLAWRFARKAGKPVEFVMRESKEVVSPSVELFAPKEMSLYAVRALDGAFAEVIAPHASTRKPLGKTDVTALLARALASRSEDRSFARALEIASSL